MKVLLAKPLVKYPVNPDGDVGVPLGLLYLASYLREKNPASEVFVKPYRLERRQRIERNLEADFRDVDIVASGGSTTEVPDMLEMFREAKRLGKITVAGGIFPSSNPDYVFRTGLVDYIVRGEGEETFSELVTALESGGDVRRISGLSASGGVDNPARRPLDLSGLPLPAYDLAPMEDFAGISTGSVYSARGCGRSCNFCTLTKHWNGYRPRPIESVIEEMRVLVDYGFKRIHFKDESMLQDRERAIALFTAIREADFGVAIKCKARLDEIDGGLLGIIRSAGVDMLHIGVESISCSSLGKMNKRLDVSDIYSALDSVLCHGIGVNPVYMFSWPGETPDDLKRNAEFITDFGSRPDVVTYISFITPHPGTALVDMPGLVTLTQDLDRYSHKQPVAMPVSLGENGLELMVDTYHSVVSAIGMEKVNPPISPDYVESIRARKAA